MGLFGRRKETLTERLLREGGLAQPPPVEPDTSFATAVVGSGLTGVARAREWDAWVTAEAPEIAGDVVEFAVVDSRNLIVLSEQGASDLSPLAAAVERELQPPYRARGARQEGGLWVVGANRIEVVRLDAEGDTIEVATVGGERTATVDGEPTSRAFRQLEQLGERKGDEYAVHAERLDGDVWQVRVSSL